MDAIPLDEEVRAALEARRGQWPVIAIRCGVSYSWLSKFVRAQIPNPGYATLMKLKTDLVGAGGPAETALQSTAS